MKHHQDIRIQSSLNIKIPIGLLIVEDLAINLSLNSVHQSILEQFWQEAVKAGQTPPPS